MGKDESHLAVAFFFLLFSCNIGIPDHHVPQKVLYPGMAGAFLRAICSGVWA